MTMQLPTSKSTRVGIDPRRSRVMLAGTPKVGKSTLIGQWSPDRTLLIDTHKGTHMLEGEHFRQDVSNFAEFEQTVDLIVAGGHPFMTVMVDLIDDIYKFADFAAAQRFGQIAAGLVEFGKGTAAAEAMFRRAVGKLLAAPVGVWFVSHTETVEEGQITRYVPKLDKRVRTYVQGACDYVFLAEAIGPNRVLHTAPSAKFEAGSRVAMPPQMDLDARAIFDAMKAGAATAQPDAPAPTPELEPEPKPEPAATGPQPAPQPAAVPDPQPEGNAATADAVRAAAAEAVAA